MVKKQEYIVMLTPQEAEDLRLAGFDLFMGHLKQFIVWSPEADGNPQFIHRSHKAALREAARLSILNAFPMFVCQIRTAVVDGKSISKGKVNAEDSANLPTPLHIGDGGRDQP